MAGGVVCSSSRVIFRLIKKPRSAWPKRKQKPCADAAPTASAPSSCQATKTVSRLHHFNYPQVPAVVNDYSSSIQPIPLSILPCR